MKLGEGGEAFFVFETFDDVPEDLQTSPIVSPATSPRGLDPAVTPTTPLQEPEFLDISTDEPNDHRTCIDSQDGPFLVKGRRAQSDFGIATKH